MVGFCQWLLVLLLIFYSTVVAGLSTNIYKIIYRTLNDDIETDKYPLIFGGIIGSMTGLVLFLLLLYGADGLTSDLWFWR